MSVTSFKIYKAFGEDSDDANGERFARHLIYPTMAFSEKSLGSNNKHGALTSNASILLIGAGGGRSAPSSIASHISFDCSDCVEGAIDDNLSEFSHPRRMSHYLRELDEGLPHDTSVVIAARQYVVADVEKATPATTRKRIVLRRGMWLLLAAILAFIILAIAQALGFDVPDIFTQGLILLVFATLIIVLAL